MIGKICAWIYKKGRRVHSDQTREEATTALRDRNVLTLNDGLSFQLFDAQNGKILQVIDQKAMQQMHFANGPGNGQNGVKTYIITPDEDVIEAITRALVEERIK